MTQLPAITTILVVPGFGIVYDRADPASYQTQEIISIGLVLDGRQIAWGDCVAPRDSYLTEYPPFDMTEGIATLKKTVIPILQGQTLGSFRDLAARIDALSEQVTITRPLPQPEPEAQPKGISRRDLFLGRLSALTGDDKPRTEEVTITRLIHPAIRYGLSQALLAALATTRDLTVTEVIAQEYSLSLPQGPVPIQVEIKDAPAIAAGSLVARQVAALGYTTTGQDAKGELGSYGEVLQRNVRDISKQLPQAYQPVLHLNLRGGLGQLYHNTAGRILGNFMGLEQTAELCPLRVEDPVILDDRQAQIELLLKLKGYVQRRKLNLQLAAGAWADTPEDVKALAEAEAVDMIHLQPSRLGSIHQTIEAILACQQRGIGVLLGSSPTDTDRSLQVAGHIALATQPTLLQAKPGQPAEVSVARLHNEMARTLAWIEARNRNPKR